MTKLLEEVIAKVRALPEEDQDALATLLLAVTNADASSVPLGDRTLAAIREGLAQLLSPTNIMAYEGSLHAPRLR